MTSEHTPSPVVAAPAVASTPAPRRRSRRGTVLVFVVGVLVLMALTATAYLTTARVDRSTTKQNEFNTQVELLLDGVKQAAVQAIAADESAPTDFRTFRIGTVDGNGNPILGSFFADRPGMDRWLGDRTPSIYMPGVAMNLSTNPPVWRFVSTGIFDQPFEEPGSGRVVPFSDPIARTYQNAAPSWKNGKPALRIGGAGLYEAGDSDGDGIADGGYVKLPIGPINGITYYTTIRIVDNNSQINATTAFSRDADFDSAGAALPLYGQYAAPIGQFGTSVGLREMLLGGTAEADTLASYKLGNTTAGAGPWANIVTSAPPGATPAPWTMAEYRSLGDLLHHGLNRRADDPATIGGVQLQGFGLNDQLALAYRAGSVRDTNASPSQVEKTLVASLQTNVRSAAYKPMEVQAWFDELFNHEAGNPITRRPLVTTHNPVTSAVRGIDLDLLKNGYRGVVQFVDETAVPTPVRERIVAYDKVTTTTPFEKLPQKASLNTASFNELWRAYLNVMIDPASGATTLTPEQTEHFDIIPALITGRVPVASLHPAYTPLIPGTPPDAERWRMQMFVRAAQAAVNTLDMRDEDEDITVRQIRVPHPTSAAEFVVNIFGAERQPFITQAVFSDDGTGSHNYGAIELYNPYDTPIIMTQNWQIAVLDRDPAGGTVTPIFAIPAPTEIAPRCYLVLESGTTRPANVTVAPGVAATPTPPPGSNMIPISSAPLTVISPLSTMPRELVLMRPRRADGVLSADNPLTLDTVEPVEAITGVDARNLVPVDQVVLNMGAPGVQTVFWRARPNALLHPVDTTMSMNFKCVYDAAGTPWQDTTVTPRALTLGADNTINVAPTNFPVTEFPTIQVGTRNKPFPNPAAPADAAVPYPTYGANEWGYPYGGFARLGDMLQVPFIGSTTTFDSTGAVLLDISAISLDAYAAQSPGLTNDIEAAGQFDIENYEWARDVLEYFTVINHPKDEYAFNVPKSDNVGALTKTGFNFEATPGTPLTTVGPVQGLVNINTAPLKVLAALPWMASDLNRIAWNSTTHTLDLVPSPVAPVSETENDNWDIAQAIIHYRDSEVAGNTIDENGDGEIAGNGIDDNANGQVDELTTFHTIADLLKIPAIKALPAQLFTAVNEPGDQDGDLTPIDVYVSPQVPITDGARNDLEEKALLLTRVSNLITTRSDSFTVYILLQGYRNAGSPAAELVVQRRAAMIVDRSRVEPQILDIRQHRVWAE